MERSIIGIKLCVHSRHDHGVEEFLGVLEFALEEQVGIEFRLAPEIITHLFHNRDVVGTLGSLSKMGLPVQAHSHFTPGMEMTARREVMNKTLEMSQEMGLRAITMHPPPDMDHLAIFAEHMAPLIREFSKHRVIMAIENVPKYNTQTLNKLFYEVQKRLNCMENHFVGLCVDIGHAHHKKRDPSAFIGELSPEIPIVNAHVHDNLGEKDEHLEIGRGDIDFIAVFQALFGRYSGPLVLEYWTDDKTLMKSALKEFQKKVQTAKKPPPGNGMSEGNLGLT